MCGVGGPDNGEDACCDLHITSVRWKQPACRYHWCLSTRLHCTIRTVAEVVWTFSVLNKWTRVWGTICTLAVPFLQPSLDFFVISQNVAICPKTFRNRIDSYCKWHAAVTSSDVSPVKVQSILIVYDHWNRRTTVGRSPLDERSARRRHLYLTTHNTYNRQTSMPPAGFESTISTGGRPQTHALGRAAAGTGITGFSW